MVGLRDGVVQQIESENTRVIPKIRLCVKSLWVNDNLFVELKPREAVNVLDFEKNEVFPKTRVDGNGFVAMNEVD
jgi:hypothetical protein